MLHKIITFVFIILSLASSSFAAAPIIFYPDIVAGPSAGGEDNKGAYLTINGLNFGTAVDGLPPATTHVYINGTEVAAYKYLGHMRGRPDVQQLSVQIGNVASGAITVETPDGTATSPENFTVSAGDMFYTSLTGNDTTGDGSFATPYRSVAKALSLCGAGDHVVIRGGSYLLETDAVANGVASNSWIDLNHPGNMADGSISGTSSAPITIMGYPGEDAIGDFETNTTISNGIEADEGWTTREWYTFSNLTFDLQETGAIALQFGNYLYPDKDFSNLRLANITVVGGMSGCTQGYNGIALQRVPGIKVFGIDIGDQDPGTPATCASHRMYVSHNYTDADIGWNYFHDNPYGGRAALQIAGDQVAGVNLVSAAYKWTLSSRGTSEYYCELAAGGDPSLLNPDSIAIGTAANFAERKTLGSLPAHSYGVGDNDSLGYNTVYVRTAASADPDAGTSVYYYGPLTWGDNDNVLVHDNLFQNLPAQAILCNLGSMGVKIYNNLIDNVSTLGTYSTVSLRGAHQHEGDYILYNNTIYGGAGTGFIEIAFQAAGHYTYPNSVDLQNNIFYNTEAVPPIYITDQYREWSMDQLTESNNVWYGQDGSGTYPTSAAPAEAQWMSVTSSTADPLFVLAGTDFHLTSLSDAIEAGADLSATLTTDFDGLARPQSTLFDIGAFEYPAGETDAIDPTVVISTAAQTVQCDSISISWTDGDNIAVTARKWRIGSAPDGSNGTVATSPATVTGMSIGSNDIYIGAGDAAGNWGSDSVAITYTGICQAETPVGRYSLTGANGVYSPTGAIIQ